VTDVTTTAVWAAGEVLAFGGNFNAFITSKDLAKQEGLIFRHLLRMILLTEEFSQLTPPDMDPAAWQAELKEIADTLTDACRQVDPLSTEETIKKAHEKVDVVTADATATPVAPGSEGPGVAGAAPPPPDALDDFAAGLE
jgi:hypothetical protein